MYLEIDVIVNADCEYENTDFTLLKKAKLSSTKLSYVLRKFKEGKLKSLSKNP